MSYWVEVEHEGVKLDSNKHDAVLFYVDGREEWIPRSQLSDEYDYIDKSMVIPKWLAEDRGFDYEET